MSLATLCLVDLRTSSNSIPTALRSEGGVIWQYVWWTSSNRLNNQPKTTTHELSPITKPCSLRFWCGDSKFPQEVAWRGEGGGVTGSFIGGSGDAPAWNPLSTKIITYLFRLPVTQALISTFNHNYFLLKAPIKKSLQIVTRDVLFQNPFRNFRQKEMQAQLLACKTRLLEQVAEINLKVIHRSDKVYII